MQTEDRQFAGLNAPLRVVSPEDVIALMTPVFAHWPHEPAPKAGTPFATVGPTGKAGQWRLVAPKAARPDVLHDPVNAICDLIVEMSWERLRSRPELLCLHAAAVAFGGRLIVFPNQRRAGKSLLTATLAQRGHAVFTDDFVPLAVDPRTRIISGVANGIAPRLRLPLPETLAPAHAAWIMDRITVHNRQYGYLTEVDLPLSGTEMPVGGVVLLDRDMDAATPARLAPVSADEALGAVVRQNFGRHVHAGAILAVTEAMATSVPVLRLTYHDVAEAADLLATSPLLKDAPAARITAKGAEMPTRPAPLAMRAQRSRETADPQRTFAKIPGHTQVETENAIYLASETGLAIHRLNPVSMMIWRLLEEPLDGDTIIAVLGGVFPDVAPGQLAEDVVAALTFMVRDGLLAQR